MAYIKSRKHAPAQIARLHPCASAALTLLALPVAAYAQTAAEPASQPATTLAPVKVKAQEEVPFKADTVSSPKFTQPLVDTPQTITVIKKELLKQQSATTLTEALRNTPGVTAQLGENGNTTTGDAIFLRGFDTSGSIFVDGIRDLGAISRDTFNLEQIEVVKGPSGSDNGRGASSGYVNLVSKSPQSEAFSTGSLSVGTADRVRVTADLNQPFDSGIGGTALRLNVMGQKYGTPGRDAVENKRWGFAPSIVFGLGSQTKTTFSYLHIEQNNVPDGGVSTFGMPGYQFAPAVAPDPLATPPVTGSRPQIAGPAVDPKNYYGLNGDYDDVTLDMITTIIEHTLAPGYTLRNTSRIGRTEQEVVLTGVNAVNQYVNPSPSLDLTALAPNDWTITRSRQGRRQDNEILTNQTNLNAEVGSGAVKHSVSAGIEAIYESQRSGTATGANPPAANLYNPNSGVSSAMPNLDAAVLTRGYTLTAAAYAFDTIKFGESFMLNGGLRFEKFHTETSSPTVQAAANDNLLSWKLGALVKPTQNSSVYVSTSVSKQPPGGNNFSLVAQGNGNPNQNNPGMEPQEGRNIELGTKWDLLGGRLALTGAIYRSENRNELVSDGALNPTFAQIGKRRVDGVELGAVGQLTPALNLSAGFSYMDSEILQGSNTATNTTTGGVIVFTPKIAFTSWLSYKLPVGLTVAGGARYVDSTVRNSNLVAGNGLTTTQDYWVADAMFGYEINKNLSLQLNINNLFDKEYVASINSGGSRYRPGEARSALLTANLTF
jgi:catecholate siderophore receptor